MIVGLGNGLLATCDAFSDSLRRDFGPMQTINYNLYTDALHCKQGGAAEACWAHNPEVGRSKLPPAK